MKTRERIELGQIDDNPWQPRLEYDQEAIEELADSIHRLGMLQAPLGRRTDDGRIQLAFGHRRLLACWALAAKGLAENHIDMDVAELSDEEMAVIALTENERRKDLSQIEVLRAHRRAIDETDLDVTTLAEQLGVSRSGMANNLRVLDLPDFVLEHVESGVLGITVAREFLVLQNADHRHEAEMASVINQIVNTPGGRAGVPDWRRRNVRKLISETVSYHDKEFRPIGPPTSHSTGGGHREATFDVDAFGKEYPDSLHTIPATDATDRWGGYEESYEKSRVWTCEVGEWRRRQTRATREANREAVDSGDRPAPRPANPDKRLERALANDAVFNSIVAERAKKGPNRPETDAERQALGSRATLGKVDIYGAGFFKVLEIREPRSRYELDRESGGYLPPWFPDLDECRQKCTIGAAYADVRTGYSGDTSTTLVCFNRQHYQEKLAAGEAAYREKQEAHHKGMNRKDGRLARRLAGGFESLAPEVLRALATMMLAARPTLELSHPLGFFHEGWSYESDTAARTRELLGNTVGYEHHQNSRAELELADLANVAPEGLGELVSLLATHHLREAGQVDAIINLLSAGRDVPAASPSAGEGQIEAQSCTGCQQYKPLSEFGRQRVQRPDLNNGVAYYIPKAECKACRAQRERERKANRQPVAAA